jgi:RNA polymerase sigma-70 factor (ECF subfamily)
MSLTPETSTSAWLQETFDTMGAQLLGYIKSMLRDSQRAEDVLQNVFLRLLRSHERKNIENVRAFAFTVARHESLREIGKRQREPVSYTERVFTIKAGQRVEADEAMYLEEALLALPPEQREVVYLKIYADLTFEEIAHALAIPANTAASRYRYALDKMRKFLEDKQ